MADRDRDRERALEIIRRLKRLYPEAKIALNFTNPFELLVATILSAQATDKKVNEITPTLFKRFPDAKSLAAAPKEEVERIIKPLGFYRQKADYIINAARVIVEKFGGQVPDTMDELQTLPGVARKTANIVLGNAFGKIEGIAIDTHVKRLSNRLGFSEKNDPDKIEKDLMELIPKDYWFELNYLLIEHGRNICTAKNPKCSRCELKELCPSSQIFLSS
jgi:endonuclease-3